MIFRLVEGHDWSGFLRRRKGEGAGRGLFASARAGKLVYGSPALRLGFNASPLR
jgi:hypothetical protein